MFYVTHRPVPRSKWWLVRKRNDKWGKKQPPILGPLHPYHPAPFVDLNHQKRTRALSSGTKIHFADHLSMRTFSRAQSRRPIPPLKSAALGRPLPPRRAALHCSRHCPPPTRHLFLSAPAAQSADHKGKRQAHSSSEKVSRGEGLGLSHSRLPGMANKQSTRSIKRRGQR